KMKSDKAGVFMFPPTVTPSHPACGHQDDDRRHDLHSAERSTDGDDEVYEGTFNEWMNLVSSWTWGNRP
ncbi:hypothetical protein OH76DRAFT_1364170, partial [Lentinus brumalis]